MEGEKKNRADRVASLIHAELSKIILREVETPPGVLVTITAVDVDKKLERALIGISVHPSEKAEAAVNLLQKRAPYLGHLLFTTINIKPMPQIVFRLDKGYEHAADIEKLLLDE
jgi:ribosome-binding factor A